MSNFRPVDRETGFLLPPSVDEWLPERHLARFVVEVIDHLDLSAFVKAYRGSGSASYHPSVLLGLLVYGYATGVFSSRKLERASYDSVAFRFIAANDHPDHDTIASFRRRFLGSSLRVPRTVSRRHGRSTPCFHAHKHGRTGRTAGSVPASITLRARASCVFCGPIEAATGVASSAVTKLKPVSRA